MAAIFADNLARLLLWGLIATVTMTTILQGSQGLGLSRLSLPFLVGTLFTANRNKAVVIGFIVYVIGGWLFASSDVSARASGLRGSELRSSHAHHDLAGTDRVWGDTRRLVSAWRRADRWWVTRVTSSDVRCESDDIERIPRRL